MTTKFGPNRKLIEALQAQPGKISYLTNVLSTLLPIICILWLLLSLVSQDYLYSSEEKLQRLTIFSMFAVAACFLIALHCSKNGYQLAAGIFFSIPIIMCWILLFRCISLKLDDYKTLLLLFSIGATLIDILGIVITDRKTRAVAVIIDNANDSFLEITPSHLQGVSFSNIQAPSNGHYFELPYEDIRYVDNVIAEDGGEPYCNVVIHHKSGTCWLSINDAHQAVEKIKEMRLKTTAYTPSQQLPDGVIACQQCHHVQNYDRIYCSQCGAVLDKS